MARAQKLFTTEPLTVVKHSDKAILFTAVGIKDAFWIPKSQIDEPDEKFLTIGAEESITIPEWLAREKDLI
jgi:hypothetical protein